MKGDNIANESDIKLSEKAEEVSPPHAPLEENSAPNYISIKYASTFVATSLFSNALYTSAKKIAKQDLEELVCLIFFKEWLRFKQNIHYNIVRLIVSKSLS